MSYPHPTVRRSATAGEGLQDVSWTKRREGSMWPVAVAVLAIVMFPRAIQATVSGPVARTWVTILLSVAIQATPFLVLGVILSSLLAAFVSPEALARMVPRRAAVSVPMAGLAGAALPGCECTSVVVAGRLVASGMPSGPAIAFLLAAPAINPIVLAATAVAFPGQPRVVAARFLASLAAAVAVGLLWSRFGPPVRPGPQARSVIEPGGSRWDLFARTVIDDFTSAGAFLAIGAAATATLQVTVPPASIASAGGSGLIGILVLAAAAVVLCVCSEADAFVAATLTPFSLTARLAFMVVGPMVDLKLIGLQAGTFGGRFAARFAPLAFVVAASSAAVVGGLVL